MTTFLIQRTCMWPEILPVTRTWSTCCVTKEIWDVGNSTVCRADHLGGRGGSGAVGVGWGAGWFLEKIQTCTLYILEVHIGKKRILHNFSVQKKNIYARSVGWKKNLFEMLPGLTVWTSFPNCYDKKDYCICTCVPAKKDSQHKVLFLSNCFFFKFTTPLVTNLGLKDREASGLSGL